MTPRPTDRSAAKARRQRAKLTNRNRGIGGQGYRRANASNAKPKEKR